MLRRVWQVIGWVLAGIGLIDLPDQLNKWGALIPWNESVARLSLVLGGLAVALTAQFWPRRKPRSSGSPLIDLGEGRFTPAPVPEAEPEPERRVLDITWQQLIEYRRKDDLMEIEADRLIQPYLHKWLRARVRVGNVAEALGRPDMVRVRPEWGAGMDPADLFFDREYWDEHPTHRGATINAEGQLLSVSRDSIALYNCRIVE